MTDPSGRFVSRVALLALPVELRPFWRHIAGGGASFSPFPHTDSPVSERGSVTSQLIIDMAIFDINYQLIYSSRALNM